MTDDWDWHGGSWAADRVAALQRAGSAYAQQARPPPIRRRRPRPRQLAPRRRTGRPPPTSRSRPRRRLPAPSSTATRPTSTRRKLRSRAATSPMPSCSTCASRSSRSAPRSAPSSTSRPRGSRPARPGSTSSGPKPKEGQPEESADVASDRAEREAAVAELDETQRLGRALLVQAEQLATQIGDRRRAGFTRALFEQSDGLLSPDLWMSVVQAIPRELRAQRTVARRCSRPSPAQRARSASCSCSGSPSASRSRSTSGGAPSRRGSSRATRRSPTPPAAAGCWPRSASCSSGPCPAIAGSWIVWVAFDSADVVPPRLEPVVAALLRGLAFVAFVRALARRHPGAGPRLLAADLGQRRRGRRGS